MSFLPRNRWISRNTVKPACSVVSVGRHLGQKKQTGSFNERRELQNLSWRERIERGCHANWIQTHSAETGGADCVLEGPLSRCQVSSWYVIVGAALPAVRNSSFCEGGLLNHLNEALVDAAVDWTRVPSCGSCHTGCAASVLSHVAGFCDFTADSGGNKITRQCLVFGSRSAWSPSQSQLGNLVLRFCAEPSFPQRGCTSLHDGEPLYQQQLLGSVVFSLQTLDSGDSLLLPVLSALTRVTAAIVLCLHICFHSVTFRCPSPSGEVGAVLVCVGFCPEAAAQVIPVLTDVQNCMDQLRDQGDSGVHRPPGSDRQLLQFVPMEEMLTGGLTEFLWTMNTEIIQHKLHLLLQS